jgi:hypothetical protein
MYQTLLARVVESGVQVVPFVGAGLSAYGDPTERLPLWRELLERLVSEGVGLGLIPEQGDPLTVAALEEGRYIEATDRILDALGEPTFRRIVEKELDDSEKSTPPAVAELVAIGWSLIVTTNLDRLISRAYLERYGQPLRTVNSLDTRALAAAFAGTLGSAQTMLAQIHGDLDIYPSWRLTTSHYRQLLRDPGYVLALQHLFLRRLFFVGFGLQDEDFDFLLKTITSIYPPGVGEFYALIARSRKQDPSITKLIHDNGLRPIFYDVEPNPDASDPFGGHRAVYECLEDLASNWAATRTGLRITLKYFPEPDPLLVAREPELDLLQKQVEGRGSHIVQVIGLGGLGKTSLIQQYIAERTPRIAAAGYSSVFGCSFYRADVAEFIGDLAHAMGTADVLSVAKRVESICVQLRRRRTLLVLDGLENIIDVERQLRSPYLNQILDATVAGHGTVLITSRVLALGGLLDDSLRIELAPLSADQVREFLQRWGLKKLDQAVGERLETVTGGHPLALRILAGVLAGTGSAEAAQTLDRSSVIAVSDEVDPLRENRLARVFDSYLRHLSDSEVAFMTSWTAFDAPASYPLIEQALGHFYPDTEVNKPLLGIDLRTVVVSLLERRLLTTSQVGELSGHPTVREYFARVTSDRGHSLSPIHRFLASEYLHNAPVEPETFEEAAPLLVACRHAAACEDWTLFDELFRRRLMRGFRLYLCENLGAWEEALGLARLGEHPSFPASQTAEPCFYPINVARCLKHLGRSEESRAQYLDTLKTKLCAHEPETAMYVNNFLTLLIWRGELQSADSLAELNVRALSWIIEPWKLRTQVEHGFSSLAYLRLLQGDLPAASAYFEHAASAWDEYGEERFWFFDYYPYYRAELRLLTSTPNAHEQALEDVRALLAIAEASHWPESICRGHLQAALVFLHKADGSGDAPPLARAEEHLEQAVLVPEGLIVPDVRISYLLIRMKLALLAQENSSRETIDPGVFEDLLGRAAMLVESSGLALAEPEIIAARGAFAYMQGSLEVASTLYTEALAVCSRTGNYLAARSSRSALGWLGARLGLPTPTWSPNAHPDLIELVGTPLSREWMLDRLGSVERIGT